MKGNARHLPLRHSPLRHSPLATRHFATSPLNVLFIQHYLHDKNIMPLLDLSVLILATIGVIFMSISSIGMMRLPDVYARMHAAGKASTLGVACLLLAAGIFYGADLFWRMIALIVLFFVTAPIATSAIARAAHRSTPEDRFVLKHDEMAERQN